MSELIGVFILGILFGWLIEWIFVRLFVPNPKKKLEVALQASRKENSSLQVQNRTLQAELAVAKTEQVASLASQINLEAITATQPTVTPVLEVETTVTESVDDDLTKLSGIGPKLAEAMQANGIKHYEQLATLTTDDLNTKLASSGIRYSKAFADSWAEQAKLAAASDWNGLKIYQKTLKS